MLAYPFGPLVPRALVNYKVDVVIHYTITLRDEVEPAQLAEAFAADRASAQHLCGVAGSLATPERDVVPAQKVQDDLEQLAELFSNDPDNRVLPQMAREISQIIDVALGSSAPRS